MQLKYDTKLTYINPDGDIIKPISYISKIWPLKHWLLTLIVVIELIGYLGYAAKNEQLISQHTFIRNETITKDRCTPGFLADLYIHDVSHKLGLEIIRRANGSKSIGDNFKVGQIVKIPINPNTNKEQN